MLRKGSLTLSEKWLFQHASFNGIDEDETVGGVFGRVHFGKLRNSGKEEPSDEKYFPKSFKECRSEVTSV